MKLDRGLEEVDGVVLGFLVVLSLLAVGVVFFLGSGARARGPTGVEPHVLGFVLAVVFVLGWFVLRRR